jgi:hypothetical protein
MTSMFATHPPLTQRIRRIDPRWDGKFIAVDTDVAAAPAATTTDKLHTAGLAAGVAAAQVLQAIDTIGQPSDVHLGYAVKVLQDIPPALKEAAHEPYKARALIYTLVINVDANIRDSQLGHLKQHGDTGIYAETLELLPQVKNLEQRFRLPLIDIAMGTLRQLSPAQYALFRKNLRVLIEADKTIDLFEWALQKIVHHHLDNEFEKRSPLGRTAKYAQISQLHQECVLVLSLLAHSEHTDADTARHAFAAASQQLSLQDAAILPESAINLSTLNAAIDKLALLKPLVKPQFLKACVACITSDHTISATEIELLRAFSNALDCPMPPLGA